MWRRIEADGAKWEVRALADETASAEGRARGGREILEFQCLDGQRQPRRVVVASGQLDRMSEDELRIAYRRALPIGGDHYGRPGKRMEDGSLEGMQ